MKLVWFDEKINYIFSAYCKRILLTSIFKKLVKESINKKNLLKIRLMLHWKLQKRAL